MPQLGVETAALRSAARTRTWTLTASLSLGWALFTLTVLHAVSGFHPLLDPVSRYAFTERGGGMLEASLLSFAIGVLAVSAALRCSGIAFGRTASVLAGATALGLVAAALFPATFTSDIDPVSGRIHQYASLVAFLCLPALAWTLAERAREVPALATTGAALARLCQAGIGSLAVFGLSYVGDTLPPDSVVSALAVALPVGMTQRLVFLVDFALLAALLVLANRAARLPQPPRGCYVRSNEREDGRPCTTSLSPDCAGRRSS